MQFRVRPPDGGPSRVANRLAFVGVMDQGAGEVAQLLHRYRDYRAEVVSGRRVAGAEASSCTPRQGADCAATSPAAPTPCPATSRASTSTASGR